MPSSQSNMLRGALELLSLKAVSREPTHGYGVLEWLEKAVGEQVLVEEGTLYPALHRLEEKGWLSASWGLSENNRRAKFYDVTPRGRERLAREGQQWSDFAHAVMGALDAPARS